MAKVRSLLGILFPSALWTKWFTYWWCVSAAVLLLFDLLWMAQTTFRPFTMLPYYPYFLLCATLLALPALFSRRSWVSLIVLLLVNTWQVCNLMYCNTYLNAIPAQSYLLAGNLTDFTDSVFDSFRWQYLLLPLLSIVAAGFSRGYKEDGKKSHWKPYCITVGVFAFLSWASDCWRGGPLAYMESLSNECYKATCIAPVYSLGGYIIHDVAAGLGEISPEDRAMVDAWLSKQKEINKLSVDSDLTRPKNIVIVFCESLESWVIGKRVDGVELTPVLNSLIADSTTFYAPNVVTQAASGRSIDAQLLMLAGMLPMQNTVFAFKAHDNRYFTLPKAMKSRGGTSLLLTCDKPHTWNQLNVSRAFGFDTFFHETSWENTEPVGRDKRLSDGEFIRQAVERMKKGDVWRDGQQALVMLVTYSGHNPFRLPEKLQRVKFDEKYPEIVRNYMITASYTDNSLLTLINYLKSRPDWNETMVVITGDHEGLAGERKMLVKDAHAGALVDPVEHTPFIVLNSPVPGRYDGSVGQVDIYSTILDLMGWDDYEWRGMGQSMFDPSFSGVAIGKAGDIQGDADSIAPAMLRHLRSARQVSDRILRYNLLNQY